MKDLFYTRRHINLEDIDELINDEEWGNEFYSYVASEGYVGWMPICIKDDPYESECCIHLINVLRSLGAEEGETIYLSFEI